MRKLLLLRLRVASYFTIQSVAVILVAVLFASPSLGSPAGDWPAIFDPLQVKTVHIEMMYEGDWFKIQNDDSYSVELPAYFYVEGEEPIEVTLRRKKGGVWNELSPHKVSVRIDVNDLVDGQKWHGVTKVNLENGYDNGVVLEGVAWYLHEVASEQISPGVHAGLAAWVRLIVNGEDYGVYLNTEFRNKQFLKNRGLYKKDDTWLYKYDGQNIAEMKVPDEGSPNSITFDQLCYLPFTVLRHGSKEFGACDLPSDSDLAVELPALINMEELLTMAAVNAHLADRDQLMAKHKNFYIADFGDRAYSEGYESFRRLYFPWDLDAGFGGRFDRSIYGYESNSPRQEISQSWYQEIILNHPDFRNQYNEIYLELLDNALSADKIVEFLNALEEVLGPELATDPYVDGDGGFDMLREWIYAREAAVRAQIMENGPPAARQYSVE